MLHKKHAKGIIKTIKAMISVKLAPIYGNNKWWTPMDQENFVMFFTLRESRVYRISCVVKGSR